MRLQDFMSRNVETITAEETVEAAYQRMRLHGIRHMVVMEGKSIVGVLSERDINNLSEAERMGNTVDDVMERNVVTARPEITVREAANMMRGRTIGCLPVVDNGKLVGIVTTTDLLDLLGQGVERIMPETSKRPVMRKHLSRRLPSVPR